MFQLYVGLEKNGQWFNHAECKPLQGGVLALLDTADKSGGGRILQIVKSSIPQLFTKDGKSLTPSDQDYMDMAVVDAEKINRETAKLFTGEKYPVFPENFFCPRCSKVGREKYTHVLESWDRLIEDGIIEENFLADPSEMRYQTVLPVGIEVEPSKNITGGIYDTIIREHLTLGQLIRIQNNNFAMENESNMMCVTWDSQIVEVEGMSERELNILRRNPKESFTKRYLTNQADIDAMLETPEAGIDAQHRRVSCSNCHAEIGGTVDHTNFFSIYSRKKSTPAQKT